jgi:trehalose-6-phosphate synthase
VPAESEAAVSTLRSSASNVPSYANSISGATDYTWHLKENTHCNGGLKNAIQSIDKLKNLLWVGTLGTNTDGFSEDLRRDIDTRMSEERSSVPVWIPDDEFNSFYDEFCHQVCPLLSSRRVPTHIW